MYRKKGHLFGYRKFLGAPAPITPIFYGYDFANNAEFGWKGQYKPGWLLVD